MINDMDKIDDLHPDKARYVLAETKLKLMNLMSQLEFLEGSLAQRERQRQRNFAKDGATNSNPVNS